MGEATPRPRALAGNTNSGVERSLRKTLNTAGDQRDYAQADAPKTHGPLENGRTCGYNGGTAQALGSAVLSGGFTLHRGMAGCNSPCPAADCASLRHYTADYQNMQQGFFIFLGFRLLRDLRRVDRAGGTGGGGGFLIVWHPCVGNAGDGVPDRGGCGFAGGGFCLGRVLRGMSGVPPPTGWVRMRRRFTRARRRSGQSAPCPLCCGGCAVCCRGRSSRRRRS